MIRLLTAQDVAARLQVSPKTVRAYIKGGRLAGIDLNPDGRRPVWRIPPEALAAFETSRAEQIYLDAKRRMGL